MPFDVPSRLPPRPERSDPVRRVLSNQAFQRATAEVIEASVIALGISRPVDAAGLAKVLADPTFERRLAALASATLEGDR